uniref:Uncharacterized protein n=1 Tax=Anguilla anguilla TaxID=7936 RepID=A0A0E9W047_ANGAN
MIVTCIVQWLFYLLSYLHYAMQLVL